MTEAAAPGAGDESSEFIDAEPAQPVGRSTPRESRMDRARGAGYKRRFALIYLALALIAGIGVGAFIVLGILSVVPTLGTYLPTGLGAPARSLALGEVGVDVLGPTLAAVVLVAVLVGVAWSSFRRQEL